MAQDYAVAGGEVLNPRFQCTECGRATESFEATIEGPEGEFYAVIPYCHFCDVGLYRMPAGRVELVEIEKPASLIPKIAPSELSSLAGGTIGSV